jgi:hypothetical protein
VEVLLGRHGYFRRNRERARADLMDVDLRLAVNYLPACACLCKVLVFMLLVGLVPPGHEVRGGYIQLAAMLYLDRLQTRNLIFDANAILMAIFFANVHAAVRATALRGAYAVLVWGLHLCWVGMCLTLLAEPARVRWFLEKRVQASRLVPVVFMLAVLVASAYIHAPLEDPPVRACRALAFTLLAFAWVYVVGIHTPQGIEYLKETSCQFVVRLAPVLYSPLWLAALFSPAAVAALALQHSLRQQPHQPLQTVQAPEPAESQEELQMQELFRQAKMLSRPAVLEVIPE